MSKKRLRSISSLVQECCIGSRTFVKVFGLRRRDLTDKVLKTRLTYSPKSLSVVHLVSTKYGNFSESHSCVSDERVSKSFMFCNNN